MFGTRLNPTKPPASHRAVLERVGAVCRELRAIAHDRPELDLPAADIEAAFLRHRLAELGVPKDRGGLGDEPLLAVMAAERMGRDGWPLARWFAVRIAGQCASRFAGADAELPAGAGPATRFDPAPFAELPDVELARRVALDDSIWQATSATFIYWLNLKLCVAAGGIGIIAGCLETLIKPAASEPSESIERADDQAFEMHVAQCAIDLEAARAVTYAAAELKAEFDRRSDSDHLRLEAGTLVNEAFCVSLRSLAALFERSGRVSISGRTLRERLPKPHQAIANHALFSSGVIEALGRQIARYYLSA